MDYLTLTLGPLRILFCRARTTGDGRVVGYGNFVRHFEQAIRVASQFDLALFMLKPRHPPNHAFFELSSAQVRIIPYSHPLTPVLLSVWTLLAPVRHGAPLVWARSSTARGLRPVVHRLMRWCRGRRLGAAARRLDVLERRMRRSADEYGRLTAAGWGALMTAGRRRARKVGLWHQPALGLAPRALDEVLSAAKAAGLDTTRPMVTLHVREGGYRTVLVDWQAALADLRNANIDTYREAVALLVARGFQVVRIGDASMRPVEWPGMLDLATSSLRTDAFELWCVLRSRFLLASDSGPYFLSRLNRMPCLVANAIQVPYYTRRAEERYICKRVYDRERRRMLSVSEMLSKEFVSSAFVGQRFEWFDNTSDELVSAVEDFLERLDGRRGGWKFRTAAQVRHDALVVELAGQLERSREKGSRIRQGLLHVVPGPGTMSAPFAARYLDAVPAEGARGVDGG
jgi:putative glycosyltransferase (TIGR04372 family)